jgi:hypothetical protein
VEPRSHTRGVFLTVKSNSGLRESCRRPAEQLERGHGRINAVSRPDSGICYAQVLQQRKRALERGTWRPRRGEAWKFHQFHSGCIGGLDAKPAEKLCELRRHGDSEAQRVFRFDVLLRSLAACLRSGR